MGKTDLAARPMFGRKRDAIRARLTIVFTALAVARETQNRTGSAIPNVIRQLRLAILGDYRRQRHNADVNRAFLPAIAREQQKVHDDLKKRRDLRH